MNSGHVYFVGAGPGDHGLLTDKGVRCLRRADVVLYDRLVNPKLLLHAPPEAEYIYVGKFPKHHTLRQELIQEELVRHALLHRTVVRLKGGDPGIFGRVGEETAALDEQNIPFDIVPGVTSGIAAPLYAGVPVTHRDYGASFAVAAGHRKKDSADELDWKALAGIETLAFYMGINNLEQITEQLLRHGRDPNEPALIIEWGTTSKQRSVRASLGTLAKRAKEMAVINPAITLVGNVNHLHNDTSWWEKKPRFGSSVVVAYDEDVSTHLEDVLEHEGAEVLVYPKTSTHPLPSPDVDWSHIPSVQFDDATAVTHWFHWLKEQSVDIRSVYSRLIATTERARVQLEQYGLSSKMAGGGSSAVRLASEPLTKHTASSRHTYHPASHSCLHNRFKDEERTVVYFPTEQSVAFFIDGLEKGGLTDWIANVDAVCFDEETKRKASVWFYIKEEDDASDSLHRAWQSSENRRSTI
ncbi:uroporphyrinogen-III C-methyltransferase [Geomicrobium sp. JCM 19037]|uniref:uroporphyrinogen-III C-methyltransferase n=1 Tax=Geomicrobium sp. JCM 19037 TaxID=1460634 RepID=UPI0005AAD432|nr:uroporphyrinogen-III C-methyltransferase [Geomicrobium sp. JCM 19037]